MSPATRGASRRVWSASGTTTSYGNSTALIVSPVTSHSVPIDGLNPGVPYHYRVIDRDVAGNLTVSGIILLRR